MERLANENKLSCKMQRNGYMLVYGTDKSIKSFVKKMAEELRGTRKK
jgi:capsular polysaccharide biosynthesis protein